MSCFIAVVWNQSHTISQGMPVLTHTDTYNAKYILNVHGSLNYSTQTECPTASRLPQKWTLDPLGATYHTILYERNVMKGTLEQSMAIPNLKIFSF